MKKSVIILVCLMFVLIIGVVSAETNTCLSPSQRIMKLFEPSNSHGALWNDLVPLIPIEEGKDSVWHGTDHGCIYNAGYNIGINGVLSGGEIVSEKPYNSSDCNSFTYLNLGVYTEVLGKKSVWHEDDHGCIYSCPVNYALTYVFAEEPSGLPGDPDSDCNYYSCRYIGTGGDIYHSLPWVSGTSPTSNGAPWYSTDDFGCVYKCPTDYALQYFVAKVPSGVGDCNSFTCQKVNLFKYNYDICYNNIFGNHYVDSSFSVSDYPSGLVSLWEFENDFKDSKGDNGGTSSAGFAQGAWGNAVSLDGSSNYVEVANDDSLDLTTFTIEAWFKLDSLPIDGETFVILNKGEGPDTDKYNYHMTVMRDTILWNPAINSATILCSFESSSDIDYNLLYKIDSSYVGRYAHVVCTLQDNIFKIYVDGVDRTSESYLYDNSANKVNNPPAGGLPVPTVTTAPLTIGASICGISNPSCTNGDKRNFFPGQIDEAAVYNRALTLGEVQYLYSRKVHDCTGNNKVVGLSASTNALAEIPSLDNFGTDVCYGNLSCTARDNTCNGNEKMVVALLSDSGSLITDPNYMPNGMVSWYRFDDNTANDWLGKNNGTLINEAQITSEASEIIIGSSLKLDGSSNYVEIPDDDSLDLTTAITLEAWFYPTSYPDLEEPDSVHPIIAKWNSAADERSYYLTLGHQGVWINNRLSFGISKDGGIPSPGEYFQGSNVVSLNEWHHVVAIYDGSNMKMYLDGELDGTISYNLGIYNSPTDLRMGSADNWGATSTPVYPGSECFFGGQIDEVAVYNRALTLEEIQHRYNMGLYEKKICCNYESASEPPLPDFCKTISVCSSYTDAINCTKDICLMGKDTLTCGGYVELSEACGNEIGEGVKFDETSCACVWDDGECKQQQEGYPVSADVINIAPLFTCKIINTLSDCLDGLITINSLGTPIWDFTDYPTLDQSAIVAACGNICSGNEKKIGCGQPIVALPFFSLINIIAVILILVGFYVWHKKR